MKIAIDIRTACGRKTGKGWYTYYVVKELLKLDKNNEYILYSNRITPNFVNFGNANIKIIHKNAFLWHFAVIKDFLQQGGKIFFAPTSFIMPAFLPKKIKSILMVHDLITFLYPHLHQLKATVLEHLFFPMALKKASHVLVPSENTKRDLMRLFHYPEWKITVTPLGVEREKRDVKHGTANVELEKAVKKKYNLPDEFILTVCGLEPRKNVSRLLEAFLQIIAQPVHKNLKLVIVGEKGWKSQKLQHRISSQKNHVLHLENLASEDLQILYRLAKVLVYPSLYEGFGLPPLEAMSNGCPVICSFAASLPEVCGAAAIFIDPEDIVALTAAIEKVLCDEHMRHGLREKGLAQAEKFTWQKTAEKTFSVISNLRST